MKLHEVIDFFNEQMIGRVKIKSVIFSGWYEPKKIEPDGTVFCDYIEHNGRPFFTETFPARLLLQNIADGRYKVELPDPFPSMARQLLES